MYFPCTLRLLCFLLYFILSPELPEGLFSFLKSFEDLFLTGNNQLPLSKYAESITLLIMLELFVSLYFLLHLFYTEYLSTTSLFCSSQSNKAVLHIQSLSLISQILWGIKLCHLSIHQDFPHLLWIWGANCTPLVTCIYAEN